MGTEYSLLDAYALSYKHALQQITRYGGSVEGDTITIKTQIPKRVPLEVSFAGHYPKARINPKVSKTEISFNFEGIGFAVSAPPNNDGYKNKKHVFETEMYINGKLVEKIKLPLEQNKRRFTPFWKYQLPKGKYEVLIKVLNPLKNQKILLKEVVIYDDKPL
jgi:hypothetical protein